MQENSHTKSKLSPLRYIGNVYQTQLYKHLHLIKSINTLNIVQDTNRGKTHTLPNRKVIAFGVITDNVT